MKISIIIPLYNAEKTIEYCVQSIIQQKISCALEIILVDDHSEDNSLGICQRLKNKYPNIKVVQAEGKGVSAARNTGLVNATGDIIGFCDSDDLYEEDILERVYSEYKNNETDIVIGGYYYSQIDELSNHESVRIEEKFAYNKRIIVKGTQWYNLLLNDKRILGSVCNKFYKRELLDNREFPIDVDYCEDLYFNAKLVQELNPTAVIIPCAFYHYIRNQNSATNVIDRLFDKDNKLKYNIVLEKLYNETDDSSFRKVTGYKIFTITTDFLYHNYVTGEKKEHLKRTILEYHKDFLSCIINNIQYGSVKWFIKALKNRGKW